MIKIQKKIFSVFVLILLFSSLSVYSQNKFPEGSAQGRTEMTGNVRMPDVPNVNISITEPKTGEEVAFSVSSAEYFNSCNMFFAFFNRT